MMGSGLSTTDIVIVNWNAGSQLRECIESILEHESEETLGALIVVDNASRDHSADFARDNLRVILLELGNNLGFGKACNLGAARGGSDYILFLNPDTRFLQPTLGTVQRFMEAPENEQVAVCGVKLVGEAGQTAKHCTRQPGAFRFFSISTGIPQACPKLFRPLELTEFDHEHDAHVPHVMGAFYHVRRKVFEQVGGFDERFFVYYEDLDLSRRILAAGYLIQYVASLYIFHRTAGTSHAAKAKALSYLLEARLVFAEKHFNLLGRGLITLGVYCLDPLRRVLQRAITRSGPTQGETLTAMRRLRDMRRGRPVDRT